MTQAEEVVEYILAHKCSVHRVYYALDQKVTRKFIKEAIVEYERRTGQTLPMPVAKNQKTLRYAEVAKYMSSKGCTQVQAAKHFGVTQQAIGKVLGRQIEAREEPPEKPKLTYSCAPIGLLWKAPAQGRPQA